MDLFDKCKNYKTANDARKMGIYPYFHKLESKQDIAVTMEGKRRIMLGSNNYLGLTANDEIIEAGKKAVEQYGTGCSGSRFLNGTLRMHVELEKQLAEFVGYEDCVTFSTGFQTNLGIISAVVGRNDYMICDRENHASIYDGCKLSFGKMLRYKHNDMEDLERVLKTVPEDAGKLIITDGVFSMGGDIAKLPEIVELAKKYGARTMVDDAHGLGVLGEGGRGTASYFGLTDQVDITMGTFSKSLASLGGYIVANHVVADYVRHNSRPFIFSASITPASCATALAALDYLRRNPQIVQRLNDISRYVREGMHKRRIRIRPQDGGWATPIVPIYTSDLVTTLTIGKELYDDGVFVNPVLPPAVAPSDCLLRTSYMATHTEEILDEAMDIIARILDKHGLLGE